MRGMRSFIFVTNPFTSVREDAFRSASVRCSRERNSSTDNCDTDPGDPFFPFARGGVAVPWRVRAWDAVDFVFSFCCPSISGAGPSVSGLPGFVNTSASDWFAPSGYRFWNSSIARGRESLRIVSLILSKLKKSNKLWVVNRKVVPS